MWTRVVKAALVVLVVANVLVAVAWWARDDLVRAGILAGPTQHIDLEAQPLPAIAVVEPEAAPATPVPRGEAVPPPDAAPPPADIEQASVPTATSSPAVEPRAAAADEPPMGEQAPALPTCIVAGPLQDKPRAEALAARFEAAGGNAQVEVETITTTRAHLVYVAPTDAETAAQIWQGLQAQGIEAFVIPSGSRRNGVSVGVFSARERAMAQRDRLAALGHSVLIHPLQRVATAFRVVGRNVPVAALADIAVAPCEGADVP